MLRPAPTPGKRALLFVFITVLLSIMGLGIVIPVMPTLIKDLTGMGASRGAELNSILLTCYAAMQFFMSPVLGALSDRFGRRPVILVSVFAYSVDFLIMAVAPTFAWLIVGRLLSGGTAATFATANAFIADVTPPEKRAASFGLIGAAFGLGFIIGPVLGGLTGEQFGARAPFYLASGLIFANFVFGYFFFPESLPKEKRRPFSLARANPFGALFSVVARDKVGGILLAYFFMQLSHHALPSIWAFFTTAKYGWSELSISLSLAYVGITAAVVQGGLIRTVVPKIGDTRAVYIGMAAMAGSLIGYAFYSPTGVWMYVWTTLGALGGFMMPGMQSKMTAATPPDAQGELQGAIASVMSISMAVSPQIAAHIFGYYTAPGSGRDFPGAPFALGAMLVVLSGIVFTLAVRHLPKKAPVTTEGPEPAPTRS